MKRQNFLTALTVVIMTLLLVAPPVNANRQAKGANARANQANMPEDRQYTVKELMDMADTFRQTGNTTALIFSLRNWAAQEPGRFDARLELGSLYIAQNRLPEAMQTLNEASAIIPSDEAPHRLLAQIYKRQGNDSLHGFHLARAAFLAQRNWENQYNLAVYQISKGRIAQAERLLAKTMELNSAFAPAKFEYAKIMLGKGDTEAAFRKFHEAYLANPGNMGYRAYYAYAAALSGRSNIASEEMENALMDAPRDPAVLHAAGLLHFHNGNNKAAEQSLRMALRYSPTDALVIETLGDVLAADFKYKDAAALYLKVWHSAGYSERIAHKLGKTMAYDGKYREARDFLEAVVSKNPKNGDAAYTLAEVYCEQRDIKRAKDLLQRFGNRDIVWYQAIQGRIQEATSESDLALISYTAAHTVNPNNPHVNAGLGRMMYKQGEFDSALALFTTAAALEPANMRNLADKAKALEVKGEKAEALKIYESIIARSPRHAEIYLAAALIKEEQKDVRGAIRLLNSGLEANPGESNLLFSLGRLYQATKQYERAIEAYQASIGRRVSESNIEALRIIGNIYHTNLADEKKAKEFFRRYVRAGGSVNPLVSLSSGKI